MGNEILVEQLRAEIYRRNKEDAEKDNRIQELEEETHRLNAGLDHAFELIDKHHETEKHLNSKNVYLARKKNKEIKRLKSAIRAVIKEYDRADYLELMDCKPLENLRSVLTEDKE